MPESHPLFPCYGRHSRMGHNVIVGHFEAMPGSTCAICRTPAMEADPVTFRLATAGAIEVVPMDGPAFFGFKVLSEAEAMAALMASQPRDYEAERASWAIKRIADGSTDADEVRRPPYADDPSECPTCHGRGPTGMGECPDCGEVAF